MPRKLGQHFLTHETVLERLAEAACGTHAARTVEIGPGRGALTRHLLPRTDELHAVELDNRLAYLLKKKYADEPKVQVLEADVMETDLSQWGEAVIVGNLPYYITSPIVEKFLAMDARFDTAVFLVQLEVAERLVAKPSTRDYGYLTVATQLVCGVELVCKVPPEAFDPPPKVHSGAVKFSRHAETPENLPGLLKFVGRCFAQKRKTLRNNLKPFFGAVTDELPEARLRAEQLTLAQFQDLYARLNKLAQ